MHAALRRDVIIPWKELQIADDEIAFEDEAFFITVLVEMRLKF
jgi:hypothetical protein